MPGANRGRRVLLLNQAFYPDVVSTAQHCTDLALALIHAGYEVTVITGQRAYDDPTRRFAARENYRGIDIIRVSSSGFGKTAKWRRAADFATYLTNCAIKLAFVRRADVVIALTSPPLISFLAALVVPIKARAMISWVMDLNPDEAIAAGWLRESSFVARQLSRMQRYALRKSSRTIALDRFMRDRLIGKGASPQNVTIIPPWSHDGVGFDAAGREQFRQAHGLTDKFVVMYSGNHSPCHPLDTALAAAQALAEDPRFVFCFVGGGSEHRKLQEESRRRGLKNVLCLPYQPLDTIGASLSAADLHLVVMGNPFVGIIHPCKIYNVLLVGAPVLYIGPGTGHIADLAAQANHGFYRAAHGDVEAVVSHILHAEGSTTRVREHVAMAQRFGHDVLVPQFVREVTSICDGLKAK